MKKYLAIAAASFLTVILAAALGASVSLEIEVFTPAARGCSDTCRHTPIRKRFILPDPAPVHRWGPGRPKMRSWL